MHQSQDINDLTIHIAFNIDHAYVRFCSVTLVSIFRNNTDWHVVAHILSRGLTNADKAIMEKIVSEYNGEIRFYEPDERLLDGFCIHASNSHISLVTYYRCMLADYLPADLHRVIYMDSDVIVKGPIGEFWKMPMGGAPVAAVEDAAADDTMRYQTLHYPKEDSYFNAGILLIDLDWWRKHDVGKQCIQYYREHPERIRFNDQDLLNSIFHGQVRWASFRFNAQEGFYRSRYAYYAKHQAELEMPVIVHYTNRKPWDWDSTHPMRRLFYDYQMYTPWRGKNILHNPLYLIARWIKLLPYVLGLRKSRYRTLA